MKAIDQLKELGKSARGRQMSFGEDVVRFTKKTEEARVEAEDFEEAVKVLEAAKE